jgi:hypothetical protein
MTSRSPSPASHSSPRDTTVLNGTTYLVDGDALELRNVSDPTDVRRFDSADDLATYRFWTEQLQFIVGRRVVRAEMVYDADLNGWKPVLLFDDRTALEILQDEEGNGPGRFAYLT